MAHKEGLRQFYNTVAPFRDRFRRINWYYHQEIENYYRFVIPDKASVLEIGCGTGDLLANLKPSRGVGIDISSRMIEIAKGKYPHLDFRVMDAEALEVAEKFDYVVISGTIGDFEDIGTVLECIKNVTHDKTRLIINYHNHAWQPLLRLAMMIRLRSVHRYQNWLPTKEIENFLSLGGYEVIKVHRRMLLPFFIPLVSTVFNRVLATLPLVNRLSLVRVIIARPVFEENKKEYSCSVIIPARNEKGTIEQAVLRLPKMGTRTEIIFVEGGSRDGTREEIEHIIQKYPQQDIKLVPQDKGKGKADAVHLGFEAASGDILFILDADLSVPPESLPRFYNVLQSGKGEFVNGTRLIYPLEDQSMKFLNFFANYFFGIAFSWLLERRITDTLCGTKVLRREDYVRIKKDRDYLGDFDPFGDFELLFGAARMNMKIVEVPVRYKARVYGETNIRRFYHGLLLLKMCWYALWKLRTV